jgi:hypothetical protein
MGLPETIRLNADHAEDTFERALAAARLGSSIRKKKGYKLFISGCCLYCVTTEPKKHIRVSVCIYIY